MFLDLQIKLAIYHHFANTVDTTPAEVVQACQRLRAQRVLALEPDGVSLRMAPPFSGVPPSTS